LVLFDFRTAEQKLKDAISRVPGVAYPELTLRQEQILICFNQGLQLKEVAVKLRITQRCLYQHLDRIRNKGFVVRPLKSGRQIVGYQIARVVVDSVAGDTPR